MRPNRHSFFLRLFLGNLLLILMMAGLAAAISYRYLNRHFMEESRGQQLCLLELSQRHFQDVWASASAAGELDKQAKTLFSDPQTRLTLISPTGRVLGESAAGKNPLDMENHLTPSRPEVIAAAQGGDGENVRTSETLGVPYRYIARPIRGGGEVVGIVRLAMPVKEIAAEGTFLRNVLLAAGAAAGLAAVGLGVLISWFWSAPLRRVSRAARKVADGDLSARVPLEGPRELAQLGRDLNEMRQSLAQRIAEALAGRSELQTVLASLREGVIATDAEGRIVLLNHAAAEMLSAEESASLGRHLQAVVRVADVLEVHSQAARSDQPVNRQIELTLAGRRVVLDVHARRLPAEAECKITVIVVVRDVTDLARTAAMKAEFVANASHELRTPLATIRVAVESLASAGDDRQEQAKLVSIMERQVARLEDMTNDLLNLHVVESGQVRSRAEELSAGRIAQYVRSQFSEPATGKGVVLNVESPVESAAVRTDRKLLDLILQNLLDNAIKFTPAGGTVTCRIAPEGDGLSIVVSDTGCGIRPQDQPRVFDRFFQSDSSRTGDTRVRGTGLGLSIVKHAADRLGAKISLQSELGRGTSVAVRVPSMPA